MSKVKSIHIIAAVVLLLAIVLATEGAQAGKPRYKSSGQTTSFQQPIVVDNSTTAFSYYADLPAGQVDIYQVYALGGEPARISLAAPKTDDLKAFTPSLALVGPGISTNVPTSTLPVTLPPDMGAVVLNYTADPSTRPTASDPTAMASIWQGQEYRAVYPHPSPYYILVWDKQARPGKYIMTVGSQDDFGLFDLIKFPYTWAKLNIWLGNWSSLVVVILVAVVLAVALAWLASRRRRRAA
jgi:hypothetical protein